MPYSVPAQTANEKGVEGLPQSLSRLNSTWYQPGHSGAINKSPPAKGSWQSQLPETQLAPSLGAASALLWKSNPANSMTLPSMLENADADGDGTIDIAEFKTLLAAAGSGADVNKLFAKYDKDGDGELTAEEIQAIQDANRKVKAINR